jgi:hypothetical protein
MAEGSRTWDTPKDLLPVFEYTGTRNHSLLAGENLIIGGDQGAAETTLTRRYCGTIECTNDVRVFSARAPGWSAPSCVQEC